MAKLIASLKTVAPNAAKPIAGLIKKDNPMPASFEPLSTIKLVLLTSFWSPLLTETNCL